MERTIYSLKGWAKLCRIACMLLAFGFGAFSANAQMSGSYTINKGGTASATNFKSFTAAMDALRGVTRSDGGPSLGTGVNGPVTITVAANSGPYTEEFRLYSVTGTSTTNRVVFNGNGEELNRSGSSTSMHVVWFDGADYMTLQNLRIRTTNATYAWGVRFSNDANYNILENCDINISSCTSSTSSYSVGVCFTASTTAPNSGTSGSTYNGRFNIIRNNEIYGSTSNYGMYWGIAGYGNSSDYTMPNRFEGNNIHNFYVYGVYMYYSGGVEYVQNRIIRGTKIAYTTFYGIYNYYAHTVTFDGNYIADDAPGSQTFTAYGVYDYYGTTSYANARVFKNNVINIQNGGYIYGAMLYWYYFNNSANVVHNTVYVRRMSGTYYYGYGLYIYSYTYIDLNIKNNIVDMDYTSYSGTTYGMYIYTYQGKLDNNVISFKNGSNYNIGYYYGTTCQTWANWQAAGNDLNGLSIRPNYQSTNPGYSNLSPMSVEIDGIGTAVGVMTDINGNARHASNPDPGAYEFDVPLNVTAINYPSAICQGAVNDVVVTVTNNATFAVNGFKLEYAINGSTQATEDYIGTVGIGQSVQYTFTLPVTNTNTGNFTLTANVRGKAPIVSNPYSVNAAPVGSYISKGATFNGAFNSGSAQDPDIVAYGDQVQHVIEPPTGYTSAQYGSAWTFDFWEMVTSGNTSAGAQFAKNNPAGGNNAFGNFTPVIGQSDSSFLIRYAIRSLSNGCIAPTVERQVFVAPRPVSSFTAVNACEGTAQTFANNSTLTSGSVSYEWNFGDGSSSVLINPAHTYSAAGTYNVSLKATSNYGYSNTSNFSITIYQNPVAEFGHTNVCEGNATPFVDGSMIPAGTPNYEWSFGDGSKGTGNNPSHQYTTPGVYTVNMKVTANGCSDEVTNYVTYAPKPVAAFTSSNAGCNNQSVNFTNASAIAFGQIGYAWEFGENNATGSAKNASYKYQGFGTFNVKLTATSDFGCSNQVSHTVTLIEAPKASFTNTSLCDVNQVSFTNTSNEPAGATTTYEWKFNDGSAYTNASVTKTFPAIGTYQVTLTAFADNGCIDVLNKTIRIEETPKVEFYVEDECEGSVVNFMNGSAGNNGNMNYSWDFGTAGSSTDKNPSLSGLTAGNYNATLTVSTPGGCSDMTTKAFVVKAMPMVSASSMSSGQQGDGTMIFSASGVTPANAAYVVFWGDGSRTTGAASGGNINAVHSYPIDGKFYYSIRLENDACATTMNGNTQVTRTGVIRASEAGIQVYPNPNNGRFQIDMPGATKSIRVFNANGQEVAVDIEISDSHAELNLGQVASGVYMLRIQTETGIYSARVTVQ